MEPVLLGGEQLRPFTAYCDQSLASGYSKGESQPSGLGSFYWVGKGDSWRRGSCELPAAGGRVQQASQGDLDGPPTASRSREESTNWNHLLFPPTSKSMPQKPGKY